MYITDSCKNHSLVHFSSLSQEMLDVLNLAFKKIFEDDIQMADWAQKSIGNALTRWNSWPGEPLHNCYISYVVHQLHPGLDQHAHFAITHAVVTSHSVYSNVLYMGLPLKNIWKLQLIHNSMAHIVLHTTRFVHVSLLLRELISLFLDATQGAGYHI